jgi:DNA-binding response OmpR family regulator
MNKILIVDDDPALSLYYQEEFIEEGYDVITSEDYEHCMRDIVSFNPDLVLLTVDERRGDGLEKLQEIRNTYYDLAVILSAHDPHVKYDPRCMAADYIVLKNSDVAELKRKVLMAFDARAGN